MKRAFDVVPHDILIAKLDNLGVRGLIKDWFISFLSRREQKVMVNGVFSSFSTFLTMSVLQGSVLGVLLFLIFINDMKNVSDLFKIIFADDSNFLAAGKDLRQLESFVNLELQKITVWFKANRLALNFKKSKCMLYSSKAKKETISLVLNNNDFDKNDPAKITPLEQITNQSKEPYIRVLGFYINETLNIEDHGNILVSKLGKAVYMINRLKNVLSQNTKKQLYFAHFHSHLNFCSLFFPLLPKKLLKKISTLQKKAIRAVYNSGFRSHTAKLFYELNILPLEQLIEFNSLVFMYRYVNGKVTSAFDNTWLTNLEVSEDFSNRVMRRSGDLHIKRCRLKQLENHPLFRLPVTWNGLKEDFKGNLILKDYKILLKEFLLKHLENFECRDILCYVCNN
jgi:hypothetical protein